MCYGIVDQGESHNGDSMGKRECLIPVWRGKGRGVEGGKGEGGSDLGTIGQTEREAKVAEDLSSFICLYF